MIAYADYRIDGRVIREAEAAVAAGFAVDFLSLRRAGDPDEELVRGVRVIHLRQHRYRGGGLPSYFAAYLTFFIRCFFKTAALHFRRRYRVIHVNNMPDFLVFCTLIPKLMGTKVILDIHDPMPNTFVSKFKGGEAGFFYKLLLWQELLSARYADRILTVSEPVKNLVLVKHGLAPEAITVITNFADDEIFALLPDYRINGKIHLVFHGTILQRSGLGRLVEALAKVQRRDKISVRIIGEGDFSGQLRHLIDTARLGDMVKFENRSFPLHEIPRILAGANVGMAPLEISSITNFALPLKLMEYVSLGLPVVTVRNAAIACYFGEQDCLFYEPNDAGSFCALLDKLTLDDTLLLHFHRRSVELREKFLWSRERQKYVALLRELAAAGRRAAVKP